MDGGAWRVTVHGVAESWTRLSTHTQPHAQPLSLLLSHLPTGSGPISCSRSGPARPVQHSSCLSLSSFPVCGGSLFSDPVRKSSKAFQEQGNMKELAYFSPHRNQLEMSDDSCV